jgi:hypothetical protein
MLSEPTAGGQYHWVSVFAPPKYRKILSFLVGMFLSLVLHYLFNQ